MGSNRSILLQKEEIQAIASETGFSAKQITRLYSRFTSLDKKNLGYLSKEDFARIPELHINPLRDRIIDVIVDDNGHDEKINFKQFAKVFSTFRRDKTDDVSKDNKLKFLFSVYDRDKDDKINKTGQSKRTRVFRGRGKGIVLFIFHYQTHYFHFRIACHSATTCWRQSARRANERHS